MQIALRLNLRHEALVLIDLTPEQIGKFFETRAKKVAKLEADYDKIDRILTDEAISRMSQDVLIEKVRRLLDLLDQRMNLIEQGCQMLEAVLVQLPPPSA